MKNIKNIFLGYLLTVGILTSVFGQVRIMGRVLDKNNKTPIVYVNIGILNSNFGTISNKDGSFSIVIPASHVNEKLIFSAIGYEKDFITVNFFANSNKVIIYLVEKKTVLDEVIISTGKKKDSKKKKSWLGNGKINVSVQGQMYMNSESAGGAMALLIEKEEQIDLNYINKALLFITLNRELEFKVRVRFLEVDSSNNNLPGDDLFNESIVINSDIDRGWLTFDLSSYNYKINKESFYLVFEWIMEDKDRLEMFKDLTKYKIKYPNRIMKDTVIIDGVKIPTEHHISKDKFPIIAFGYTRTKPHLKKYKCYYRNNSFGIWHRATGIISAKVLMSNKP